MNKISVTVTFKPYTFEYNEDTFELEERTTESLVKAIKEHIEEEVYVYSSDYLEIQDMSSDNKQIDVLLKEK